jgi:hypothetical protein
VQINISVVLAPPYPASHIRHWVSAVPLSTSPLDLALEKIRKIKKINAGEVVVKHWKL